MSGFSLVLTRSVSRGDSRTTRLYVSTRANVAWRRGVAVKMNKLQRRLLALLAAKPGCLVTREQMIDVLWGDDPKGGPDSAEHALTEFLSDIEFRAIALGLRLQRIYGRGALLEACDITKEAVAFPNDGTGSSPSCSGVTASTIPQQAAI